MNKLIDISNSLPIYKNELNVIVDELIVEIDDGYLNALDVRLLVGKLDYLLKAIKDSDIYKDNVISEFEVHKDKDLAIYNGCEISCVEMGVRYNYEKTEIHTLLSTKLKDIESIAKKGKKCVYVDEETGEEHEIFPAIKRSTTTTIVKLPEESETFENI